jgi:hypothetical protein
MNNVQLYGRAIQSTPRLFVKVLHIFTLALFFLELKVLLLYNLKIKLIPQIVV